MKKHSAKWDRCVAKVKKPKRAVDPFAVCTKSLGSRAFNPRDREMARAAKLYESFRERAPTRIKRIGIAGPPRIAVDIGHVEYIGYRTTHGRKLTLYQHDFAPGSRPLLCVSPDGRQLLLLGGRYQFTDRGIVDRDISGREIDNPDHGAVMRSNPRRRKNAVRDPAHKKLLNDLAGHFESDERALAGKPKAVEIYRDIKIQQGPRGFAWPNAGWFATIEACRADIDAEMASPDFVRGPEKGMTP